MISTRQLEIFNNLTALVQDGEAFYAVDQIWDGVTYRIFAYRLASYTEFMKPDALEARGIMFELDANGMPVRLACRPMHKFFNLNENPSTIGLDISTNNVSIIMDKADGSLISTWLDHNGKMQLKSKTSLSSDQVRMAWTVLNNDADLLQLLTEATEAGMVTVNLEYVGPDNRIVIGYDRAELRALNLRDLDSGEYDLSMHYWSQHPLWGRAAGCHDSNFELDHVKSDQGYEGVVVVLKNGQWFKLKTDWYAALHKTKDSINSKRKLFECVINEATDDLKSLFFDDPTAMQIITDMELLVIPKFNRYIRIVEDFFNENRALDRKAYAIKGQAELDRPLFSLAMNKYLGRANDYKAWAVKHIEMFGVKDEVVNYTADTKE